MTSSKISTLISNETELGSTLMTPAPSEYSDPVGGDNVNKSGSDEATWVNGTHFEFSDAVPIDEGGGQVDFRCAFCVAIILVLVASVASSFIFVRSRARSNSFYSSLRLALRTPMVLLYFLYALFGGAICSLVFEFLFVVIARELRPPAYFIGLMTTVMVISELPAFVLCGEIHRRLALKSQTCGLSI
ncbi:unnamed protein product [Protopolystoma xenopodis]|uniref:Major facilitator superfamily associated domain-containing protein n=1 Tax=Protopolystoma xenopodis TaxID=117903 RepID=A0A3S5CTE4_9PLAT|nr:unnamed protein product [Protopolystoma xenopodis]